MDKQVQLEQLMQKVGNCNKYQYLILLIFLTQWYISVFVIIGPLYFLNSPEFQCISSQFTNYICDEQEGCEQNAQIYSQQKHTITIEFQLYCQDQSLRNYLISILFFGSIFGNFVISYYAEIIGRKKLLILSWGLSVIGIFGTSICFNKYLLLPLHFLMGFGLVPSNGLNLILLNESCGDTFRQKATTILLMSWASWEVFLSGSAYFIQNWRNLYIFGLGIPSVLVFFANFYIEESPKFYYSMKLEEQFKICLQNIMQKNGLINKHNKSNFENLNYDIQQLFQEEWHLNVLRKKSSSFSQSQIQNQKFVQQNYNFLDLVRIKSLRFITIASCCSMFVTQLTYYTTQLSLGDIGTNIYTNAIFVAMSEAIQFLVCNLIINKLPRKKSTIFFMGLCNLLCLSSFLIEENKILQTLNASLIRMCNCMTQGILAVYVHELYPTPTRSLGVGMQMGIGLLGSTFAPFANGYFRKLRIPELGGIGLLILPLNLVNIFFKETHGQLLKDTIEQNDSYDNQDEIII